jgi:hypothetical protein
MATLRFSLVSLILLAAACRGGGSDGGDDDVGDDDVADDATIYDIQSDAMEAGTAVTVRGVVVTAVDAYGKYKGDFYVQEPDGGAYSGVQVFASAEIAADLAPGDLVDIEGAVKDEFALQEDATGRKLTELKSAGDGTLKVTKVGEAAVPEPVVVNPWELTASDDEAEKWEGVVIRFEGARVFYAPQAAESDMTREEMTVTGPYRVESALTDLDDAIARDACFTSITGIGSYFFNFKLLPRTAADLVVGTDGDCLPIESELATCEDSVDNDYNGFADCSDFGCQEAVAACVTDTTIAQIQAGAMSENARVHLTAVVTGRSFNGKRFWVQDGAASGPELGVYAFRPSSAEVLPAGVVPGATIELRASVSEYDCGGACSDNSFTQLGNVEIVSVGAVGAMPTPAAVAADVAVSEPYEGALVTLSDLKVSAIGLESSQFAVTDGTTTLMVDDDIFRHTSAAVDQCVTVTGIMHMNTFDNTAEVPAGLPPHVVVLPRSAADIVAASGCD